MAKIKQKEEEFSQSDMRDAKKESIERDKKKLFGVDWSLGRQSRGLASTKQVLSANVWT